MTKQSVIDKLIAEGATQVSERTKSDGSPKTYENLGKIIHIIDFRPPATEKLDPEPQIVELSESGSEFKYYRKIPNILRDIPAPPDPPRDFTYTEQQIKTHFETVNPTWEVQVVTQSINGIYDNVTIQVLVDDDHIIHETHIAWTDDQGTKQHRPVQS